MLWSTFHGKMQQFVNGKLSFDKVISKTESAHWNGRSLCVFLLFFFFGKRNIETIFPNAPTIQLDFHWDSLCKPFPKAKDKHVSFNNHIVYQRFDDYLLSIAIMYKGRKSLNKIPKRI